jgi:hypothetical protein
MLGAGFDPGCATARALFNRLVQQSKDKMWKQFHTSAEPFFADTAELAKL